MRYINCLDFGLRASDFRLRAFAPCFMLYDGRRRERRAESRFRCKKRKATRVTVYIDVQYIGNCMIDHRLLDCDAE